MSLSQTEIQNLLQIEANRKTGPIPNPDAPRARLWGLSDNEFEALKKEQKGKCFLCKRMGLKLELDHDHTTKKARRLLCKFCNQRLGFLESWIKHVKIQEILEYMELGK